LGLASVSLVKSSRCNTAADVSVVVDTLPNSESNQLRRGIRVSHPWLLLKKTGGSFHWRREEHERGNSRVRGGEGELLKLEIFSKSIS
jgi:hypothetical protein